MRTREERLAAAWADYRNVFQVTNERARRNGGMMNATDAAALDRVLTAWRKVRDEGAILASQESRDARD